MTQLHIDQSSLINLLLLCYYFLLFIIGTQVRKKK